MLTPEQLEARKAGIGGSDEAVLLGLSPWKTELELYYEKRGEWEEPDLSDNQLIHFGNMLEDVVAQEYARRNDVKVERRNNMLTHKKHPFLLANIDRKVVGSKRGLECKTADKFTRGKWGEDGTDNIPDYYRVQCEHYMIVTGYTEWDLAVLIGGNEYRQYHIQQDKELSEIMIEKATKFWEKVQKGIAPEIDFNHKGAVDLMKKLYPGTNGETIELPAELLTWHETMQQAQELAKTYSNVVDGCKARILAALGENACGTFTEAGYQYKRSETKRKETVMPATSFMVMRGSKYTPK